MQVFIKGPVLLIDIKTDPDPTFLFDADPDPDPDPMPRFTHVGKSNNV
jgi:hypothetical protein